MISRLSFHKLPRLRMNKMESKLLFAGVIGFIICYSALLYVDLLLIIICGVVKKCH